MLLKCEIGHSLTVAEQTAIDYINRNVDIIADLTISDIAERAFVSTSTVSRAIRKCGITKMTDVRYKLLVGELAKDNIRVNDILNRAYLDCVNTIEKINTNSILKVIEQIHKARIIHILAGGVTRLAAQDLEFQLQGQGYNAYLQWDSGVMKRMDSLVCSEDLLIVLTVQNRTEELLPAMRTAKAKGAKVVLCCCTEGTTLEQYADIIIYAYSQVIESKRGFDTESRLGLQIVARTIVEYLASE